MVQEPRGGGEGELEEFMDLLADLDESRSQVESKRSGMRVNMGVVYDVLVFQQSVPPTKRKVIVEEAKVEELDEEDFEETKSSSPPPELLDVESVDSNSQTAESTSDLTTTALALIQAAGSQQVVVAKPQPKRRHRFRPRVNPFPRILKRDVRRDYSPMLVNCLNSASPEIIGGFFYQFCVPTCRLQDSLSNANVLLKQLDGVDNIASMLGCGIADVPDFICRIRETHIKQHLYESGSKIVMKLCSQGTKLMSYFASTMGGDATKSVTSVIHEKLLRDPRIARLLENSAMGNPNMGSVSINAQIAEAASLPPEIAQHIFSVEIRINTTATLYLDENHRIYFMDMKEDFEAVGM